MTPWNPARWPLRIRVTLAFLAAAGVVLAVLGVVVQVRVGQVLEDRLRETITAEAGHLEATSPQRRAERVEALSGEIHAQVLTESGEIRASSKLLAEPLLEPDLSATPSSGSSWDERVVTVFDDDAAAAGDDEPERERLVLFVRPTADGTLVVGASREDVDEALATLRTQLLVAGPLGLVVAGGLGYVVAGAGLRPLERMRARAAAISSNSAAERLPVPAAEDELRRLALTLNGMLERLDEGLQRERRFVAEASHDLRTPLALILTEVELALAQPRTAEELTRALDSVQDEVRRLIALAEDLLERARADGLGMPLEAGPVDLVALAERVADRFRTAAEGRGLRVVGPGPIGVHADAARLDRVLSNLIDNALRHATGEVAIEVLDSGDTAELTVTDHGSGAPRSARSSSDRDGLGLRIVREIVRAHGGTVDVRHTEDGTRVRVTLPSAPQ